MQQPYSILYCEHPLQPGAVDPDFTDEWHAATANGYTPLLFDFEMLTHTGDAQQATRKIKPATRPSILVYRGWMLTPAQYAELYAGLRVKNYVLINTPEQYRHCHYLLDSLKYIKDYTPATVFEKLENEDSIPVLIRKAGVFGDSPVILKDYVKSEKHDWATACFVPRASDTKKLRQSIHNLVQLRGPYLNEGIVIREFVPLKHLTLHSKSGMPLTEEYRLFFAHQKLAGIYNYWEEGVYQPGKPDTAIFETLAQKIDSNFFSMDIARKEDGSLIIIELGDGQVAGLPEESDLLVFYKTLSKHLQHAGAGLHV